MREVSFVLPRKKISALIGRSGAGKTVLGCALVSLLPGGLSSSVTSYWYDNRLYTVEETKALRGDDILFLPQNAAIYLNPSRKIGSQLAEINPDGGWSNCRQVVTRVGLYETDQIMNSYPFELSEGMNMRCMLAMALLLKPRLLILDEPTAALDKGNRRVVARILRYLRKVTNTSILVISHDFQLVGDLAEYLLVLDEGKLVDAGVPERLLFCCTHPYTAEFLYGPAGRAQFDNSDRFNHID